ncbi:PKD domain-containing protein [Algoriphagus sp. CAU 1675]|uniref:PKD domain-containing protein n=1 Tax=Algoriphagus sp. CAU 1675 TaxID=3032597 RepID=UPI0023DAC1A3|nr:PKD domain-containing protein [Algoriphagus sp. CAU 1675]MDF2159307.1 PKD domain-containing protein [Algoriphagus sp. CAU 1675]
MRIDLYIRQVTLLFFLLLPGFFSFGQTSTVGREFLLGFMDNNRRNTQPDRVVLIITANEKAAGTIQTPKQTITFSLEAGEQLIREFDGDEESAIHRESGKVEYKPFWVKSSGDITLHAINGREYSSDGTVVLPLTALSTEYLVTAHFDVFDPSQNPGSNQNFESTLLVVATSNDTEVEVIPSARTVNTIPAGSPIRFILNEGESYQIKALEDLTGSRVRVLNAGENDCKLVAVFGGNKTSSAGDCGTSGDHIFQQAYPLESWGKSYIHIPLAGRTSGEIVKVLASQDDTEVRINGQFVGTLNARKFAKFEFAKNETAVIETSKPSSVAVIAKSGGCNEFGVAPLGDPSLFTLSPNEQRLKNITFSTGKLIGSFNQNIVHYLTVLVPKSAVSQTILNGQNIGGDFLPIQGSDFEYARVKVNFGVNQLINPEGFIGYVYGSGSIESYGFAIGASLQNLQFETETTYDFEVDGDKVACLNQEGTWEILPENSEFKVFEWDFGDGSEWVSGQEVTHIYEKEGKFLVTVYASTGEQSCGAETEFTFEVEVNRVSAELKGPESVCPDSRETVYFLENPEQVYSVLWEQSGGTIISQDDSSITIDWGIANQDAYVRAIPVAENGCLGEVLEIKVEITDDFIPEKPEGQEGICGTLASIFLYSIPYPSDDKNYVWYVEGGQILSGQNTVEVEVNWDLNAPVRSLFYEESNVVDGSCAGTSEALVFSIYEELIVQVEEVENPSCPGSVDGRIELSVSGGSGEFVFVWVHNSNLEEPFAEGLSSGTYEVRVTDLSGCATKLLEVELVDPKPLELGMIDSKWTSCSSSEDGSLILEVKGGTAPYSIAGFESEWDGNQLTIIGFSKGIHQLQLMDSKGCTLEFEAEVGGPEELSLEFIEESPGCPGGLDGGLKVVPSGGTPPYFFEWENGLSTQNIDQLASGEFFVRVTDSNGCEVSGAGKVSEAKPQVRMPSGFNPVEGPFVPVSNCSITFELFVFNRWGQLMYSGSSGWDGIFEGEFMPPGVYSYLLQYEFALDGEFEKEEVNGAFTLVR